MTKKENMSSWPFLIYIDLYIWHGFYDFLGRPDPSPPRCNRVCEKNSPVSPVLAAKIRPNKA